MTTRGDYEAGEVSLEVEELQWEAPAAVFDVWSRCTMAHGEGGEGCEVLVGMAWDAEECSTPRCAVARRKEAGLAVAQRSKSSGHGGGQGTRSRGGDGRVKGARWKKKKNVRGLNEKNKT